MTEPTIMGLFNWLERTHPEPFNENECLAIYTVDLEMMDGEHVTGYWFAKVNRTEDIEMLKGHVAWFVTENIWADIVNKHAIQMFVPEGGCVITNMTQVKQFHVKYERLME